MGGVSKLWQIPDTWLWTTMGNVAEVVGGGTPSTKNPKNFEGSIPWITPADLSGYSEKHISGGVRSISKLGFEESGARWLPKGTVLFSSRAPIGYVAIASRPVTTNQGFKSFIPAQGVLSDYVYYWLTLAKSHAESLASGTTFLELSGAKAALIPFPLAPTAEQARIVEKIEELLTVLDAGVEELKTARKKLLQYRQSLLNVAANGGLTEKWRENHRIEKNGVQLVHDVLNERRSHWEGGKLAKITEQGKKPIKGWQKESPDFLRPGMANLSQLPSAWEWANVQQIVSDERHSLAIGPFGSNLKVSDYRDFGVPLVFVRNIRSGNYGGEFTKFISQDKAKELNAHSVVAGDVLVTKMGEPPGDADVYPDSQPLAVITADCIKIRCNEALMNPFFLKIVLNSNIGKRQIGPMTQGVAQKKVSLGRFSNLTIPVPPVDEQKMIVRMIGEAENNIRAQLASIDLSLQQCSAQRKNILRTAFSGQLTPQDPRDESVHLLMERIFTQKNSQKKVIKSRKNKMKKEVATVGMKLVDVLSEAGDWLTAQEAFHRCGVADHASTAEIEVLYAELRTLDKSNRLSVEPVVDSQGRKITDRIKLVG
nr:restriction endonuclease subunit S [Enterobacter nematophilus]